MPRGCWAGAGWWASSGGEADGFWEDSGWDAVAPDAGEVTAGAEVPGEGGFEVLGELVAVGVEALGCAADGALAASGEGVLPVRVGGLDAFAGSLDAFEREGGFGGQALVVPSYGHRAQRVAHLAGRIPDPVIPPDKVCVVPPRSKDKGSPTLHGMIIKQHTRRALACHHLNWDPVGSEVDGGKKIVHFEWFVPAVRIVTNS